MDISPAEIEGKASPDYRIATAQASLVSGQSRVGKER
jgi:hypothetical protein